MISRVAVFLGVLTFSVVLTACGGDGELDSDIGPDGGQGQTWEGRLETGTRVALTLWVEPSDPDLADFEAFRQAVGAEPVLYARVEVTNDSGAEDVGRFVTLTDASGEMYGESATELNFLCTRIARWIAVVATTTTELVDQYNTLLEEHCAGNPLAGPTIPPRDSLTYFVTYEGLDEPEFERVFMGAETELEP